LEEGILKNLERREKLCLDAVESSKVSLAVTRRNALDIVTRFKGASGGIVTIALPWLDGVESEAYDSAGNSCFQTSIPVPFLPPCLMAPSLPAPITGAPDSTPDTNAPALTMHPTTVVDHRVSSVPLVHDPLDLSPKPTPTSSLRPCTGYLMEEVHTPCQYDGKYSILLLTDSPTGADDKGGSSNSSLDACKGHGWLS